MDVVYHLWDKLILFNDNLISHFIVIAFLIKKKDEYINKAYLEKFGYTEELDYNALYTKIISKGYEGELSEKE